MAKKDLSILTLFDEKAYLIPIGFAEKSIFDVFAEKPLILVISETPLVYDHFHRFLSLRFPNGFWSKCRILEKF